MSVEIWRLVNARRAATAFDGEGARRFGGRWNSPGARMVYAAESRALAALELLVHLQGMTLAQTFKLFPIRLNTDQIENLSPRKLPSGWNSPFIPADTQLLGDEWSRTGQGAALRVPSAIIPGEFNYLLKPDHKDFGALRIGAPETFYFDPRLKEK